MMLKPSDSHSATAHVLQLTTKLNCIAVYLAAFASASA